MTEIAGWSFETRSPELSNPEIVVDGLGNPILNAPNNVQQVRISADLSDGAPVVIRVTQTLAATTDLKFYLDADIANHTGYDFSSFRFSTVSDNNFPENAGHPRFAHFHADNTLYAWDSPEQTFFGGLESFNNTTGVATDDTANGGPGGLNGGDRLDFIGGTFANGDQGLFDDIGIHQFPYTAIPDFMPWGGSFYIVLTANATSPYYQDPSASARYMPVNQHVFEGGDLFIDHMVGTDDNDLLTSYGGEDVLSGGYGDDVLAGGSDSDVLAGGEGQDWLFGGQGDDLMHGGSGEDWMDGGAGSDLIDGGSEFDTVDYSAKSGSVVVTLNGGRSVDVMVGGTVEDTIRNVENVTGGSGDDRIFGDSGWNVLLAQGGNDLLRSNGGLDTLDGGDGNDTADFSDAIEEVIVDWFDGNQGNATVGDSFVILVDIENLIGGAASDQLEGSSQDNVLNGMGGVDIMTGNGGHDWYYVDNAGDQVIEAVGEGTDRVLASVNYTLAAAAKVELLTTTTIVGVNAINLTGNGFNQFIEGNAGANIIDGKGGGDTMTGYGGNDWYMVYSAGDKVIETANGGSDRVYSAISYTLAAAAEVEFLATNGTAGTGSINLTGNGFAQAIYGNAGGNIIDGKAGADTMVGNGGNDFFYVDNAGDRVIEAAGAAGGTADRVFSSVNYTLAAGVAVETLSTSNNFLPTAINLTGNEFGQTIYGNAGANIIDGKGGADLMQGQNGNDWYYVDNAGDTVAEAAEGTAADRVLSSISYTLTAGAAVELLSTTTTVGTGSINLTGNGFAQAIYGNAGANILNGKAAADTMTGYGGADIFVFDTALGATNIDTITDYNAAADTIRLENAIFTTLTTLGTLAAGAFMSNTTGVATQADDRIIYENDTGRLFYDRDGLNGAAGIHFATLTGHPTITNADFVVV